MKITPTLVILFVLFQATPLLRAIEEQSIQGQWSFTFVEKGFTRHSRVSLLPNGKYREYGTVSDIINGIEQSKRTLFQIDGSWKIDGDKVVVEVNKSNVPKYIQVGSIKKFQVIEVTRTNITYLNLPTKDLDNLPTRSIYKAPTLDNPAFESRGE